jgi:hypothetical protein
MVGLEPRYLISSLNMDYAVASSTIIFGISYAGIIGVYEMAKILSEKGF